MENFFISGEEANRVTIKVPEVISHKVINEIIQNSQPGLDTNLISDGFHTFQELYEHRVMLFIALCRVIEDDSYQFGQASRYAHPKRAWKSKVHSDGTVWPGWFIAGIGTEPGQQISYHLPDSKWDLLDVEELDQAPNFDGHTSDDVLKRLAEL